MDTQQLAGAVVIVARRGAVAYFEARGRRDVEADAPMGKDTIFRIYSMTKAVGSVAAMMLCEEGKLQSVVVPEHAADGVGIVLNGNCNKERVNSSCMACRVGLGELSTIAPIT